MSTHRCLDALALLMSKHNFVPDQVTRIEAKVGQVNMVNLKFSAPETPRQAQFSMQYGIATMLRYRKVELADFTPHAVRDPKTRELMSKVELIALPNAEQETINSILPHEVAVHLRDGSVLRATVSHPKGDSLNNPFTAQDRKLKFEQCVRGILSESAFLKLAQTFKSPPRTRVRSLMSSFQFPATVDEGSRFLRSEVLSRG